MAAPTKQPQSRWGAFLSSAVTGIETRLDDMLTEEEQQAQKQKQASSSKPAASATTQAQAVQRQPSPGASRSSSNTRMNANDRLQARLAKAMASKQAGSGGVSPRASVEQSSRPSVDRPSSEGPSTPKNEEPPSSPQPQTANGAYAPEPAPAMEMKMPDGAKDEPETPDVEVQDETEATDTAAEPESQASVPELGQAEEPGPGPIPTITEPTATPVSNQELDELKARHQEELQEHVERIDSLQSKLQYLSKSAAETAKQNASSASAGSMDKKLAERDEKIALLMEEGQKLSSSEQKYRATIKKLRQQVADNEKQKEESNKSKERASIEIEALRKKLSGNDDSQKRQEETRKATASLQKEIESLKKDRANRDETIRNLQQESKKKLEQLEAAHSEASSKALATERERQRELEDTVATLRSEKEALADKARLETLDWREKLDRALERSKTVEAELKHELQTMESKLEAMRTAAEEASSGPGGEAQVKLLRQIETLQTQYSSASDNWQGIESSLLAKVANLEKERDEAQRRESEMRRKARDASSKSRSLEEELEDLRPALTTAQQELETAREQLATLRTTSKSTETALEQVREDLEKQLRTATPRNYAGPEAERQQWLDEIPGIASKGQSRPESPLHSVPRTYSSDLIGLPILSGKSRKAPTPGNIPDLPGDGLGITLGRRLSSQPPIRQSTLSTTGSNPPPTPFSPYEPTNELARMASPSIAEHPDDSNNNNNNINADDTVPSSPRAVAQDMISVSTAGAGPSVQLVERMSSAIRRLEAEKVAAREEMARVCSQRDEARGDMVGLMKEVEASRAATEKVTELEGELQALNARYQTTLEMLGEKSELVEELRADVQDVKDMYRELVERTVK